MFKHKKFLIFLFSISLLFRILFFLVFLKNNPCALSFDSGQYHSVATQLAAGNGFSNPDGSPHVYRTPGYPLFLAFCYKLFGQDHTYALLLQIILASIIPLLIFLLAQTIFPSSILTAKISALVSVVHPGFLIFSGVVMTETFFVLFFLAFLIILLRSIFLKRIKFMPIAGILLSTSSLIRPVGFGIELLIAAAILIIIFIKSLKSKIQFSLAFIIGWIIPYGLWLTRNFLLTGFFFLHTLSGPHFFNHGAVRIQMYSDNSSYKSARRKLINKLEKKIKTETQKKGSQLIEIETCRIMQSISMETMISHPFKTINFCVTNILKTLFSLYSAELLFIDSVGKLPPYNTNYGLKQMILRFLNPQVQNIWIIFIIYLEIFLLIFTLIGFGGCLLKMLVQPDNKDVLIITILFATIFIGASCVCGFARLRLPIEPFLIMVSVKFWIWLFEKRRQ